MIWPEKDWGTTFYPPYYYSRESPSGTAILYHSTIPYKKSFKKEVHDIYRALYNSRNRGNAMCLIQQKLALLTFETK